MLGCRRPGQSYQACMGGEYQARLLTGSGMTKRTMSCSHDFVKLPGLIITSSAMQVIAPSSCMKTSGATLPVDAFASTWS